MRLVYAAAFAAWLLFASGSASAQALNSCGCYQEPNGTCKCTRKSKCGCPGECEPVGCEAKRSKEADREAAAELKRIAAREKKMAADAAKAAKEKDKAEKAAQKTTAKGDKAKAEKSKKDALEKAVLQLGDK
jgi:hypothetical protein